MKKSLLIIAAMGILPLWLKAQPTIVQGDFPVAGTLWFELSDNRTGVHTVTAAGPSQAWNYATAFIVDDTTGINFIPPSSVPTGWATNFPNATVATYSAADTVAQFFKSTANGFYLDGFYTGSVTSPIPSIDLNPDQLLVPANFTYNSTRNNTSVVTFDQVGPPNIRIKLYTVQTFLGDAHGSLVTPAGTFSNTLRIKATSYTVDSTFIDALGTGTYAFVSTGGPSDTTITYNWLQNGSQPLLMTISYDVATAQTSGASFTSLTPLGVNDENQFNNSVSVYPNPTTSDWVNFEFANADADILRIYAIDGRLVREEVVTNINKVTLSTATFGQGMYIYQALDRSGQRVATGRFAVSK